MNNLLKIFLIFNLVSSATSQVNNFSVPLSEENLMVGQNSSELVKRGEPITLVGGTDVIGYTISSKETCQSHCTLSFPVLLNDKGLTYKGYLVSFVCTSSGVLVNGTLVGHVLTSYNFKPELGLEYAFVSIYYEYWSDDINRNIAYSRCDSTGSEDALIPLTPTPSQPPLNFSVCAYGGKSGSVCGEIVESGVTITVHVPGSCEKKTVQFFNVIKVRMDKPYSYGDLGAPVYIPLRIPGHSKQTIASPVGQVVEAVGNSEENIWYYIPLDRILKDSGLKIASGDKSPPTQSSNVSLSDNLLTQSETKSNISKVNVLTKRVRSLIFSAGDDVLFSPSTRIGDDSLIKRCTLGFAIRQPYGLGRFNHGFLTLGSCLSNFVVGATDNVFSVGTEISQEVRIGTASNLDYSPILGLNHAIVKILPNNNQYTFWDDNLSTYLSVPGGSADVIPQPRFPHVRDRVCFEGGNSGHSCGTVAYVNSWGLEINPWVWWETFINFFGQDGLTTNFYKLIKVRMDSDFQIPEGVEELEDLGSPVYYVTERDADGTITEVQPVCLVFYYNKEYIGDEDRCVEANFMYCVSIARVLSEHPELELIGSPQH